MRYTSREQQAKHVIYSNNLLRIYSVFTFRNSAEGTLLKQFQKFRKLGVVIKPLGVQLVKMMLSFFVLLIFY